MPYPSRLSRESIISTARDLIAEHGAADVSLHRIARALDVKTPSLYRYVRNKNALLRTINETTLEQLYTVLKQSVEGNNNDDPAALLLTASHAYRDFAAANYTLYNLLFNTAFPDIVPDSDTVEDDLSPIEAVIERLVKESGDRAAITLQGLLSLMHGFVTLEQSGQFEPHADAHHAYTTVVRTYLNGVNGQH